MNIKNGFTLLETLVAVTVLTVAVAGPFFAASRALMAANLAGQKLTASYLAQEGLEYVQAMRSNTFLEGALNGFTPTTDCPSTMTFSEQSFCHFRTDSGLDSSVADCRGSGDGSTKCALDPGKSMDTGPGKALRVCTGACEQLNIAGGVYTLDSGTASPYTREIQIYESGLNVEVIVTVSWQGYGAQTVVAREYLSAWQ